MSSPVHYTAVIMGAIVTQITSLMIVYSTVYSDADQRKHKSAASQASVRGIHRGPVNSPHKWPVTRKMFPFDNVIMFWPHRNLSFWQSSTSGDDQGVCIRVVVFCASVMTYAGTSQWETTLQCNDVSRCMGAYIKWSCIRPWSHINKCYEN